MIGSIFLCVKVIHEINGSYVLFFIRYAIYGAIFDTTDGNHYLLRRRKLIGDYIPYRRLIVYYAVFEREGVVCEWL